MKTALIIGGGIAGPVAALALQRAGFAVTVFEARRQPGSDAGSYLSVASNGLDALAAIGADRAALAGSFSTTDLILCSGAGKRLATLPIGARRPSGGTVTVRRATLHRALHEHAASQGIRFEYDKRLVDAATGARVRARFADGSEAAGDLIVGCDGIHSATRRIIDPHAPLPRYVGLLNFGGYTAGTTAAPPGAWQMIFGKRAFFGYTTDPAGGTVWFANVPRHPATRDERARTSTCAWKEYLAGLFAEDCGPARTLIAAGEIELAADNTHDLPSVPVWHRQSMIVIGDAAHAPSPSSGQGASLAIEDGVVLAKCLRDLRDTTQAFAAFERLRRRRAERIVAHGARSSHNKTAGPIGRVVRDLMLPWVFRYLVNEKSLSWIYDYRINWDTPVESPVAA
jgi:2-polyprenyl-6-methoxyphenol hydroxylase-like FAD-dependent oxidoreductase